ncbi:MAG: DUF2550 domain-containing protein [Jiangellaceae bacterium]|nr:DUF2550 domain-containing protein [Jiangellaceae bacterium]
MSVLEWAALVIAAAAAMIVLGVSALFLRRSVLQRDGGFDMCLRVGRHGFGNGWVFGIGRYRGDALEWFRTFSFGGRPNRSLRRAELGVVERRTPDGEESAELPSGHLVLTCRVGDRSLDVSMSDRASTAFLAWLEAAPPGGHLVG